jgi:hypothetical protein
VLIGVDQEVCQTHAARAGVSPDIFLKIEYENPTIEEFPQGDLVWRNVPDPINWPSQGSQEIERSSALIAKTVKSGSPSVVRQLHLPFLNLHTTPGGKELASNSIDTEYQGSG